MKTKISNSIRLETITLTARNTLGYKEDYLVIVQPGELPDQTFKREVKAGRYWINPVIVKPDVRFVVEETGELIAYDFENEIYYSYKRN